MNDHQQALRQTKILATLGPASQSYEVLSAMVDAGLDMVRINCSHGTHDAHRQTIETVRKVAHDKDKPIGILVDLQGPKIRVANFKAGFVDLEVGQTFCLDPSFDDDSGDETIVGVDYKDLHDDVSVGDTLLLDDGRLQFSVISLEGTGIHCRVEVGGRLSNHKGINREGGGLTAPAITEKDKDDLSFALSMKVDYVAISFPRCAADLQIARDLMEEHGQAVGLIAKIERIEAMENLEEIIIASDGIMVARGDLAVEIGDENVPLAQKKMIDLARMLNKPVITATQMMETMIKSTVPTRAEVSDVANAVLDRTDVVMLSAESAVGDHPPLVISEMSKVCMAAESDRPSNVPGHLMDREFSSEDESISMASIYTANHVGIKAIIALTESGRTPLLMSRIKSAIPVYAFSRHEKTVGLCSIFRGVYPLYFDVTRCSRLDVDREAVKLLKDKGLVVDGDLIIMTKGDFLGVGGCTNVMKILTVGQVH